jgi:hypothetical protein
MGFWEWSHEVNTLDVKYLHLQVVMEGHCMVSSNASLQLTLPTPLDEFFGVFVHYRLEEPALPNFGLCAKYFIVAFVWCYMAFFYDLLPFCRWYASPQQSIRTHPVQVWVIPKVTSALNLELLSTLVVHILQP